jgi:hypothetical protein
MSALTITPAAIEVALPTEVTSPVRLALVVTFDAVPVKLAVIVPAVKLPLASRATIADAVLALVAVVALLLTLPAVEMVASLVSAIAAEALMSTSAMVPLTIFALATVIAVGNAPVASLERAMAAEAFMSR